MDSANPLRRLARVTPAPLDGLVEYGAGALNDLEELVEGLPDDPLEAWDPEHIRRTLPWLRAINSAYFRPDVRGLENIPPGGPAPPVGNPSGGLSSPTRSSSPPGSTTTSGPTGASTSSRT